MTANVEFEQGLTKKKAKIEDLVAPSTLEL